MINYIACCDTRPDLFRPVTEYEVDQTGVRIVAAALANMLEDEWNRRTRNGPGVYSSDLLDLGEAQHQLALIALGEDDETVRGVIERDLAAEGI